MKRLLKTTPILIVGVGLILFPSFATPRLVYFAIWSMTGVLWALGLNVFLGYCGQINFGVAGFGAIAAYTFALLVTKVGFPAIVAFIAAIAATALTTYVAGLLFVRLRHLVLGLATFAFSIAVYVAVRSGFRSITGGDDGLRIAPLMFLDKPMGDLFYYYVLLAVAFLGYFVAHAILHSRTGRAMRAIGDSEEAAVSLGVEVNRYMGLALILNAIYSAFAAIIFVQWNSWVSPEFFSFHTNVLVLVAVALGGIGNPLGAAIGGAFIFILPHLLIGFAEYHLIIYGGILALLFRFAPSGAAGAWERMVSQARSKSG